MQEVLEELTKGKGMGSRGSWAKRDVKGYNKESGMATRVKIVKVNGVWVA